MPTKVHALDIPVGKIFPSDRYNVTVRNGVVSAIPKGVHEYPNPDDKMKLQEVKGEFPHVTMVPFNEGQLKQAQKNAGKDDFVLKCTDYHVTDQGEVRIWRQFQQHDGGHIVASKSQKNNDSNVGVFRVYFLQNCFLCALEGNLNIDIGGGGK